jgi:hypothetical protein
MIAIVLVVASFVCVNYPQGYKNIKLLVHHTGCIVKSGHRCKTIQLQPQSNCIPSVIPVGCIQPTEIEANK